MSNAMSFRLSEESKECLRNMVVDGLYRNQTAAIESLISERQRELNGEKPAGGIYDLKIKAPFTALKKVSDSINLGDVIIDDVIIFQSMATMEGLAIALIVDPDKLEGKISELFE